MEKHPGDSEDRKCPNCGHPFNPDDRYCAHCGQKHYPGRLTLWDFFNEFAESLFNVDSKIFRTFFALFVPGKLTRAFIEGRRRRYVHPLRLFLVTALIFFAALNFIMLQDSGEDLKRLSDARLETSYRDFFIAEMDSLRRQLPWQLQQDAEAGMALDSMQKYLDVNQNEGYHHLLKVTWPKGFLSLPKMDQIEVSHQEYYLGDPDALLERHQINDWPSRLLNRQMMKLNKNPGQFSTFILGHFSWMLLLMMPALAGVLKLLYIRRDFYYPEHLVFLFHTHSLVFVALSLAMLVDAFDGVFSALTWVGIIVFLYLALRGVYGQGWFRSLVKFSLMVISYLLLFGLFLTLNLLISALIY